MTRFPLRLGLLALLALPAAAAAVAAAPTVVLLESFTNTACGPCAANNPIVHDYVEDAGTQVVLNLQYHVYWPSATDPFYGTVQAQPDNLGRITYYGVNAVPDLVTAGANLPEPGSYAGLAQAVGIAAAAPAPLALTVATQTVGSEMKVDVQVSALADAPGALTLRIALVEPYVYLDPPGADNGERNFYCTMRDMLPTHAGQAFTIANGQTLDFSQTGILGSAWQNVYAVAWVQRDSDRQVLQAGSSLPVPSYAFLYAAAEHAALVEMGLRTFDGLLQNRGTQSDTYDVHVAWDVPGGWGGGVCEGGTCHPIGDDDFAITVRAGEEVPITVDIEPVSAVGQGTATVTMTSRGDPARSWSQTFRVITYGTPILLVDDDGGAAYQTYYEAALDAAGFPYGTWSPDFDGAVDAAFLSHFPIVVWNAGWAFPSLTNADRAALTARLEAGGRLFISGQDIGWDLCDPTGTSYSPAAMTWYRTYLGAQYISDDTDILSLTGVAGDPIGDGLFFNIYGGTGANNQSYPSEIQPYDGGAGCLLYSAGREAAVHLARGAYRTVYFAFGFEGIATATDRALVMSRVLDWLGIDVVGVPDGAGPVASLAGAVAAAPNPFNPRTVIDFEIAGPGLAPVDVDLFDPRGRLVRSLWKGPLPAGRQRLAWDGRDGEGRPAAGGVYLARVQVAGQSRTLKLTLAK